MNKPNGATEHLDDTVLKCKSALLVVLLLMTLSAVPSRADEATKENALHKAAQEWIQVGTEQHNRALFKAAEKSFRRAAIYRNYLTDAERKKLDELLEQSANAAMAKELTSAGSAPTDNLAPPVELVDSDHVVALDTRSVEVKPQVEIAEPKADSIKDGKHLTKKERQFMAEEPVAAASSLARQMEPPARPAPAVKVAVSTETVSESGIRFEPGDVIEIKFFYTPELDITQTLRPDGRISMQLIGEVTAQGKTAAELRNDLIRLYDPYLKAPEIAVVARSFYNRRVFVGGQVVKPGIVEMPGRLTALEAIMEVGGFDLRAAERKNVIVIRYTGGRRYAYKLDLKKATAGDETEPFYLRAKDIVYVPRTGIAKLNQWIDQHINKIIPDTGLFLKRTSGNTSYGLYGDR